MKRKTHSNQCGLPREDSFGKNSPNATLIINQHLRVAVITGLEVQEHGITFTIKEDGPNPITSMRGKFQIFIDGNGIEMKNDAVSGGTASYGSPF